MKDSGVRFLALSLESDETLVRDAASKWKLGALPLAVAESEALGPLGVNQVPATLFIGSDGVIIAAANGERDARFIRRRVEELLARERTLRSEDSR